MRIAIPKARPASRTLPRKLCRLCRWTVAPLARGELMAQFQYRSPVTQAPRRVSLRIDERAAEELIGALTVTLEKARKHRGRPH